MVEKVRRRIESVSGNASECPDLCFFMMSRMNAVIDFVFFDLHQISREEYDDLRAYCKKKFLRACGYGC